MNSRCRARLLGSEIMRCIKPMDHSSYHVTEFRGARVEFDYDAQSECSTLVDKNNNYHHPHRANVHLILAQNGVQPERYNLDRIADLTIGEDGNICVAKKTFWKVVCLSLL